MYFPHKPHFIAENELTLLKHISISKLMKIRNSFLMLCMLTSFTLQAQWSSDPNQNLAVSDEAGEQTIPKIATSPAGISYISWYSNEGGNYNMRLQRFDVYGNKQWADEGLLISNNTSMTWLTDYDMCVDSTDCAIIVFQDIRTGDNNIFAYRIDTSGAFLWGADGLQLSNSSAFDAAPKVTVTGNNDAVIAWEADGVIIRQKISPGGSLLWGNNGISMTGTNSYKWPQLLPVGSDDVIMKFFEDIGPPNAPDRYVYAQRYDDNGNAVWAQACTVSDALGISAWTQIFPFINDGQDGFYMAWHDDRDNNMLSSVYVQHIDPQGDPVFTNNGIEVATMSGRNRFYAQLALPPSSDNIYIFWNEMDANQNNRGIYGQKINQDGNREWTNNGMTFISLSPTDIYPFAARQSSEDMIVFYEEALGGNSYSIKAMRIDTTGSFVWGGQSITMCSVASEKLHSVANNFNYGQWIATWGDGRNSSRDIYGQNIQLDGSLGSIPPLFHAVFTADETSICEGSTVNFTDQSIGNPTSWEWTFEGGDPATSTDQNPTVTYYSSGTFDVELIITDGSLYDTLLSENLIQVSSVPQQTSKPSGDTATCQDGEYVYSTNPVPDATNYNWNLSPSDAGTLTSSGTTADFSPAPSFTGSYSIKVRAENFCGTGAWSEVLNCSLYHTPFAFQLSGDGAFCENSQGAELYLDGSENGVDYELFLDDISTGVILTGTGDTLIFGYFTDEGMYSSMGFTDHCSNDMGGQIWVHMLEIPGQAAQASGPETSCNNMSETYTTTGADNADHYNWLLDPTNAGTLFENELEVLVEWSEDFTGQAYLSVSGENSCGSGSSSDELEITLNEAPNPDIMGENVVCVNDIRTYYTEENSGSTYEWLLSGGDILSGSSTHEIEVKWTETEEGTLQVIETFENTCVDSSALFSVLVDDCPFIKEAEAVQMKVYPNPATSHLFIEFPDGNQEIQSLQVFNNAGLRLMQLKDLSGNLHRIDISGLSTGLYLAKLILKNGELLMIKFQKAE